MILQHCFLMKSMKKDKILLVGLMMEKNDFKFFWRLFFVDGIISSPIRG